MSSKSPEEALVSRARRRVGMKTGFAIHALVYVLVNAGLWAIAGVRGDGHWNLWPLAGWGLGLAIHGVVTLLSLSGEGLRERMVRSEVERLRRR